MDQDQTSVSIPENQSTMVTADMGESSQATCQEGFLASELQEEHEKHKAAWVNISLLKELGDENTFILILCSLPYWPQSARELS